MTESPPLSRMQFVYQIYYIYRAKSNDDGCVWGRSLYYNLAFIYIHLGEITV